MGMNLDGGITGTEQLQNFLLNTGQFIPKVVHGRNSGEWGVSSNKDRMVWSSLTDEQL